MCKLYIWRINQHYQHKCWESRWIYEKGLEMISNLTSVSVCVCEEGREGVAPALLSTPRSHVSHDHTDTNVQKKSPNWFGFSLRDNYACCYLPTRPSHRHITVSLQLPPTYASHTCSALPPSCSAWTRRAGARSVHWQRSWSRKRRAELGEELQEERQGWKNRSCRGYGRKGEAGPKKNDCGAFGRLSGGIRVAGCWKRTTAFPCAETSGTFRTGGSAALPRYRAGWGHSGGGEHPFIAQSALDPGLRCQWSRPRLVSNLRLYAPHQLQPSVLCANRARYYDRNESARSKRPPAAQYAPKASSPRPPCSAQPSPPPRLDVTLFSYIMRKMLLLQMFHWHVCWSTHLGCSYVYVRACVCERACVWRLGMMQQHQR